MKKIHLVFLITNLALIAGLTTPSAWSQGTTLYATGFNEDWQLGTGDYIDRNTLMHLTFPGDKIAVQADGG
jgi:hypothetical protein